MFYRYCQSLVQILGFRLAHQIVHQHHQYFQLRAQMHSEERGEAADRHGDGVLDESGEELYKEYDFVRGTDLPVEENEVTRTRQVSDCDVLFCDGFPSAQRHDRAKIQTGRVHEYTAQNQQTSGSSRFVDHRVASASACDILPIVFHSQQTRSHLIPAEHQVAVLEHRQYREHHRRYEIQSDASSLLDEDYVQNRRDQLAAEEEVAAKNQKNSPDILEERGFRLHVRPDTQQTKNEAIQLHCVSYVFLVIFISKHFLNNICIKQVRKKNHSYDFIAGRVMCVMGRAC